MFKSISRGVVALATICILLAPTVSWAQQAPDRLGRAISLTGGVNTISVWMREDGMQFNRILLRRDHTNTQPETRCGPY